MTRFIFFFASFLFANIFFAKNKANGQAKASVFLAKTYEYEGGSKFTDISFDGHYTKFGIILSTFQMFHRTKKGDCDIDKDGKVTANDLRLLTWSQATQIYKVLYWNVCHGDNIKSQRIANIIVDFVVNSGFRDDFLKYLQKQVGVSQDGKIGLKTINAINNSDECKLFNSLLKWRLGYYKAITKKKRLSKLFKGLKNRLKKICCNENYKNEKSNYTIQPNGCNCMSVDGLFDTNPKHPTGR